MKNKALIDNLKRRLLLLKKNIVESHDEVLVAKEETDSKYVYSIDNEAVLVQPTQFTIPSSMTTPEDYSSPPSSRQEELFKVLDLSDPNIIDAISTKLQKVLLKEISHKEIPETNEEESFKNRAVAIDSSAVIYMNDEEESDSRDSKTPLQSKIPSRSGNECIHSMNDIQMLIVKLLKLKETTEDETE